MSSKKHDIIWGAGLFWRRLKVSAFEKYFLFMKGQGSIIHEIIKKAELAGIPLEMVRRNKLKEFTGQNHQGVVAYTAPYSYLTVGELLQKTQKTKRHPFFLMLDHIQDPHNFGSLLRTAGVTGVDGIIIPRDRACGVTPAVFKSSAGSLAHVPVARTVNLA